MSYFNYTFKMEEMRDQIEESIETIKRAMDEQNYLIDTLEKTKDERFTSLIEQLKKGLEDYIKQVNELSVQLNTIRDLCEKMKTKKNWEIACLIFESLNIFKRSDFEEEKK